MSSDPLLSSYRPPICETPAVGNLNRWIDRTVELAVAAIFMVIVIVGGLQVLCFALNIPLNWSEEVTFLGMSGSFF